jgi:anti-anti-sigma regulatory factor
VLRIDEVRANSSTAKLKLEGRILGAWVSLLEEKILECLEKNKKVLLDFSELTFVDEHGVEMLRKMPTEKVEIKNCPQFIEELLKG